MKKRLFLAAFCGVILAGAAKAAGPEAVPDAFTVTSQFKRIVLVRLKNQVDMLAGLQQAIEREKIKNAVILSGVGSLMSYQFHVVSNTSIPATSEFTRGQGPFDLLSVNGYILDGRVHAHITFSNAERAMGGHLEADTRVHTFAILTLGVLEDDLDLKRFDDQTWR